MVSEEDSDYDNEAPPGNINNLSERQLVPEACAKLKKSAVAYIENNDQEESDEKVLAIDP